MFALIFLLPARLHPPAKIKDSLEYGSKNILKYKKFIEAIKSLPDKQPMSVTEKYEILRCRVKLLCGCVN
jgi:hypothetical protein